MINPDLAFLLSSVYGGELAPEHRTDLEKSHLTEELIRSQLIRSVPPSLIDSLLGFPALTVRSALIFPYFDLAGALTDHVRLKIFPAQEAKRGTVKYLQPRGARARLYVVRRVLNLVLSPGEPLVVCEGEKKTLRASGLGLAVVGLAGVEGWHVRGSSALLPEFDAIPLEGRVVDIIPDGDYETNGNVERAVRRFADVLRCRGADPRRVRLPTLGAPA